MMRLIKHSFLFLLVFMGMIVDGQDIEEDWTVWLYTPHNGILTFVHSSVYVALDFELPLPEDISDFPADVYVSPDATLLAYSIPQNDTPTVIVAEWGTEQMWTFPVDTSDIESIRFAFHMTEAALELGYTLYHPMWHLPFDLVEYPDRPKQFAVSYLDGDTYKIDIHDLNADTIETFQLSDYKSDTLDYRNDAIIFSSDNTAYELDTQTGTITELPVFLVNSQTSDFDFDSGDAIFAEDNVLYMYSASNDAVTSIYSGDTIMGAEFVDDGHLIVVNDGVMRLIARDSELLLDGFGPGGDSITQVVSVPGGLLFNASRTSSFVGHIATATDNLSPGGAILYFDEDANPVQIIFVHSALKFVQ